MPVVKLRNNTPSYLFISTLSKTLPPKKDPQSIILMDEEVVSRDSDIQMCLASGQLSVCPQDGEFEDTSGAEEVSAKKTERKKRKTKSTKKSTQKKPATKKSQKAASVPAAPPAPPTQEPSGSDVVVGLGKEGPEKAKMHKSADNPMPDWMPKDEVVDIHELDDPEYVYDPNVVQDQDPADDNIVRVGDDTIDDGGIVKV